MLSASLKTDLERRGEGARALELFLFRVDGAVSRIAVGASMPMREPRLIGRLFHERLAALETSLDAGYGFDLVRLSVFSTALFETGQADLTGETASADEDIALFADRVRARLGKNTVLKPMLIESHLPERAAVLVPFDETKPERAEPPRPGKKNLPLPYSSPPERPLRLFSHPEPIDVPAIEVPEGPPPHFRWRRAMHRVARAGRPRTNRAGMVADRKRTPGPAIISVSRMSNGHRYWLYREGLYGVPAAESALVSAGLFRMNELAHRPISNLACSRTSPSCAALPARRNWS